MPNAIARNTIAAVTDLRTRIRFEASDPATDPAGNTRSAGELRYSNTEVDAALNDQLVEMGNFLAAFNPADSLLSTDVTLTDGEATLPSAIGQTTSAVYKVELLDAADDIELVLDYVPYGAIRDWPGRVVYSLVGGTAPATSTTKIIVRPKDEDIQTLRVWYIAPPIVTTASTDTIPHSDRWRELLALGSAMKLLSVSGDATDDQRVRLRDLWAQFSALADRIRGPRRARMRNW